jgi:LmbE family N-acetylglucosaminyl deacetylase
MAAVREKEQTAAAAAVGVTDLRWLRHPDGRLQPSLELRRDISRVIRQVRPDLVITQSPQRSWERIYGSHPDHLAAGEAALCAVYPDARNPFAHPELLAEEALEPWSVRETWVMQGPGAQHHVDVTDQLERKLAALSSHVSQNPGGGPEGLRRSTGAVDWDLGSRAHMALALRSLHLALRKLRTDGSAHSWTISAAPSSARASPAR